MCSCQRIAAGKHADVQVIELAQIAESGEGESKTKISVEQVDQILHSVNLAPFEGKYRVFIIDGVEFMSIAAANRLLKTIEEPVTKCHLHFTDSERESGTGDCCFEMSAD